MADFPHTVPFACEEDVLAALCALSGNFTDAYILDLNTLESQVVRYSDGFFGSNPDLSAESDYIQTIETCVGHNVSLGDRERMQWAMSPVGIRDHLGDEASFVERFRVERNGESVSYYMKCSRLGGAGELNKVVVAFSPENTYSYAHGYVGEEKKSETQFGKRRRKVLVVEDSEFNREMLTAILGDTYDVVTAVDGRDGLEKLAKHHRELSAVLLDLVMPVCDGYEFLRASQADDDLAEVPVIVTTSVTTADQEVKCLSYGASDFVPKPYNPRVVLGRLKSVIRLRESVSTLAAVELDGASGAYTRQSFLVRGHEWIASRSGQPFHIMVARISHYRSISTILGRTEGNKMMAYLGERYLEAFPNTLIGRVEIDTFALLVQADKIDREWLVDKLNEIVKESPFPGLSLKYGAYEEIDTTLPLNGVIDRAMIALAAAESNGLIDIAFFNGPLGERVLLEQKMEAAFNNALEDGEFVAWYQPKYNARTGKLGGAEALVRWKRPNGTMVAPSTFVPLFEKDGNIAKLDECMFYQVCAFQKNRLNKGLPVVPISVNLSRTSLLMNDVATRYSDIVKLAGIPYELVPIEVTESIAVEDVEVVSVIHNLSEAGFPLHLDDFGAGFSSLASLASMPLTALKIDKTLVDKAGTRDGDVLLKFVCGLAEQFNLQIIVEGVETKMQVDFLRDLGCELIQGFYFSKPCSEKAFTALLDA